MATDVLEVIGQSDVVEIIDNTPSVEVIDNGSVLQNIQNTSVVIESLLGAAGPAGPAGTDAYYLHNQTVASSGWLINHNLGRYPNIAVLISGEVIEADVRHTDVNSAYVQFPSPQVGKVVLS